MRQEKLALPPPPPTAFVADPDTETVGPEEPGVCEVATLAATAMAFALPAF